MCRLLGYATAGTNKSLEDVLGEGIVREYLRLSLVHNDGWGAALVADSSRRAGIDDGGAATTGSYTTLYKSTEPAYLDPAASLLAQQGARGALFHLRLASSNLPLIIENQQPFSADAISFIHNGDISDDSGRNLVHDPDLPVTREQILATGGKSDSAIYFAVVLHHLSEGKTLPEAVAAAIADLRKRYPHSSYNCMVQTENTFIVANAAGRVETSPRIVEIYNRFGLGERSKCYRVLRYRDIDGGGVVVASSGFPQDSRDGWRELPNNHMLVASNRTGRYDVHPL